MFNKKFLLFSLFLLSQKNSFSQTWLQISDFPSTERDDGSCFIIGTKAYCGTGLKTGWVPGNDMYAFNMDTETWSVVTSLPVGTERQYASGFSYANFGFIFGGMNGTNYYNDLYRYDTITENWEAKTALPSIGRMGTSCFVIDNIAYIIGGRTVANNSIDEVWAYNISTDSWTQKNNLPFGARWRASAVAQGNKGYLVFGMDSTNQYGRGLFEYDPNTDSWTLLSSFPYSGRIYTAMQSIAGDLILLAGLDSLGNSHNDMWRINTTTLVWQQLASIPAPGRKGGMCFNSNTTIYYTTGIDQTNIRLKETWKVFNPNAIKKNDEINSVRIYPNPCNGIFNVSMDKLNNDQRIIVSISDIFGNSIRKTEMLKGYQTLDISQHAKGIYFVKIENGQGVELKKIVVE